MPEIKQAFKNVCFDKMLADGYFDMSKYIYKRIRKEDIRNNLEKTNSRFLSLFLNPYATEENAVEIWKSSFGSWNESDFYGKEPKLSHNESEAIVYWVYMVLKNALDREKFTLAILSNIKQLHAISNNSKIHKGIVFNSNMVDIKIISSLSAFNKYIIDFSKPDRYLFYRGHSSSNYVLSPAIYRSKSWLYNEDLMHNELIIQCPSNFEKCNSHLEKLVEMQHYGLPTRLLDITRNSLVALYFSCTSNPESYGEVVLLSTDVQSVKYPQSDTATILSSLPRLSNGAKEQIKKIALNKQITEDEFNQQIGSLLHVIRLEKPAFIPKVQKKDVLMSYIVFALKNNNRIIKQDGAFILCGLSEYPKTLNSFRYRNHGKAIILMVTNKKKILQQLDSFSINHATLFPEIECVADYIKDKYQ